MRKLGKTFQCDSFLKEPLFEEQNNMLPFPLFKVLTQPPHTLLAVLHVLAVILRGLRFKHVCRVGCMILV